MIAAQAVRKMASFSPAKEAIQQNRETKSKKASTLFGVLAFLLPVGGTAIPLQAILPDAINTVIG